MAVLTVRLAEHEVSALSDLAQARRLAAVSLLKNLITHLIEDEDDSNSDLLSSHIFDDRARG